MFLALRPYCDRRCKRNDGNADAISALLAQSKDQVQRARETGGGETCRGQTLTADEANAQLLYEMVTRWEVHVEVTMGLVVISPDGALTATGKARLGYRDGMVVFGDKLDPKWHDAVKKLGPRFPIIAKARHWCAQPATVSVALNIHPAQVLLNR